VTVQAVRSHRTPSATINATAVPSQTSGVQTVIDAANATAASLPAIAWPGGPACAAPRNVIGRRAYQPDGRQVACPVDLVVHEHLLDRQPANHLETGLPAYSPQGFFEMSRVEAGSVPAQLVPAISAPETNLAHPSRHAVPGDAGTPWSLIAVAAAALAARPSTAVTRAVAMASVRSPLV
jgi:hypothetical protein